MHTRENYTNTAMFSPIAAIAAHLAISVDRRGRRIKSPSASPALDSLQVLWTNLAKYGLLLSRFVPERKP